LDDYQYSNNKNFQNNNINAYTKTKVKSFNPILNNEDSNFDSYYHNKYNHQYETPYNKVKNPVTSRLSTIRLKQYIRDNYPNITPRRVYEYLMNTPSINQFKRKLMNTPYQKRDLFNAREEMERREIEREREREREHYFFNSNNNPYSQNFYRGNNSRYYDDSNSNNNYYNKGMNYYTDFPRKSYDYNNKENMIPNNTFPEYNNNNINPYSYNPNKIKNLNIDSYTFHQRNKVYNEPDTYVNDYPNYNNNYYDNGPGSFYNEKEKYINERIRKNYMANDNPRSSYPYSMNNEFQKGNNHDPLYGGDEYLSMHPSKEYYQRHEPYHDMNDNEEETNISEGYNKSSKSFIKPITVRAETESTYFEKCINFIRKINNSWKLGKYIFGTSMERYVSILIPDIQLQQWAIQSKYLHIYIYKFFKNQSSFFLFYDFK